MSNDNVTVIPHHLNAKNDVNYRGDTKRKIIKTKRCEYCSTEFTPTSGFQKYCDNCRKPRTPRPGISPLRSKKNSAIAERIERLGKLNDEHRRLFEAGDVESLMLLADEYLKLKHPCTVIARAIRMQAEMMRSK